VGKCVTCSRDERERIDSHLGREELLLSCCVLLYRGHTPHTRHYTYSARGEHAEQACTEVTGVRTEVSHLGAHTQTELA